MVDYSHFTPHPSFPEIDVQNILNSFCKKVGKKITMLLFCSSRTIDEKVKNKVRGLIIMGKKEINCLLQTPVECLKVARKPTVQGFQSVAVQGQRHDYAILCMSTDRIELTPAVLTAKTLL